MTRIPVALLFLIALCAQAHAVDAVITCGEPTKNTDGSALTDLASYSLFGGISQSKKIQTVPKSAGCKFTEANITPGLHKYTVTATNASGVESAQSPEITLDVPEGPTCPPSLPTETRTQACTAPLIGNWTQTRGYVSAPAPQCWGVGPWLPTEPAAGVCAAPSAMLTADVRAYEQRSATLPLALIGITTIGQPCGPETVTRNGVKYCKVAKSAVDAVVWPQNLAGTDFWVKASP